MTAATAKAEVAKHPPGRINRAHSAPHLPWDKAAGALPSDTWGKFCDPFNARPADELARLRFAVEEVAALAAQLKETVARAEAWTANLPRLEDPAAKTIAAAKSGLVCTPPDPEKSQRLAVLEDLLPNPNPYASTLVVHVDSDWLAALAAHLRGDESPGPIRLPPKRCTGRAILLEVYQNLRRRFTGPPIQAQQAVALKGEDDVGPGFDVIDIFRELGGKRPSLDALKKIHWPGPDGWHVRLSRAWWSRFLAFGDDTASPGPVQLGGRDTVTMAPRPFVVLAHYFGAASTYEVLGFRDLE